jgi:hypothetical protein
MFPAPSFATAVSIICRCLSKSTRQTPGDKFAQVSIFGIATKRSMASFACASNLGLYRTVAICSMCGLKMSFNGHKASMNSIGDSCLVRLLSTGPRTLSKYWFIRSIFFIGNPPCWFGLFGDNQFSRDLGSRHFTRGAL